MHGLMARSTKRDTVVDVGAKVDMRCKWLDVVSLEVSAPIIPAVDTDKAVARHHIVTPPLHSGSVTFSEAFNTFPVYPAWSFIASRCRHAQPRADFLPDFDRPLSAALRAWLSFASRAHGISGFTGVCAPLEGGDASLGRFACLHASARKAPSRKAVIARPIGAKFGMWLPHLAFCAAFQAFRHFRRVGFLTQSHFLGRDFARLPESVPWLKLP